MALMEYGAFSEYGLAPAKHALRVPCPTPQVTTDEPLAAGDAGTPPPTHTPKQLRSRLRGPPPAMHRRCVPVA